MEYELLPEILPVIEINERNNSFQLLLPRNLYIPQREVEIIATKLREFFKDGQCQFSIPKIKELELRIQESVNRWIEEGVATPIKRDRQSDIDYLRARDLSPINYKDLDNK